MSLTVRSRQSSHPVDAWRLRRLAKWVLAESDPGKAVDLDEHALGVFLVDEAEMARANWEHLRHEGPTDVITLDFGGQAGDAPRPGPLLGEIFICPVVAEAFAREHGTTWSEEVARYLIHGILHLRGYDDRNATRRKRMKREEERLVGAAAACFPLSSLAKRGRVVGR